MAATLTISSEISTEYDDMGDHLLQALLSRAKALEQQMRYAVPTFQPLLFILEVLVIIQFIR